MTRLRKEVRSTADFFFSGDQLVKVVDRETGIVRDVQVAQIYDESRQRLFWVRQALDAIRSWAQATQGINIVRLSMWSEELAVARCQLVPELHMDPISLSRMLRRQNLPWPGYRGDDPLAERDVSDIEQ